MRILIALLTFITFAFANIGKVSTVVGDAKIERAGTFLVIKTGVIIEEKDIIRTSKNSKVQLIFNDNTIITVGKNSALNINEYLYDTKNPNNSKTDFNFFKGAFKTITGQIGKINKKKFKLRTKTASIGIRGTIVVGNQSMIACTQGAITVEGAGVSVNVEANELTLIQENSAPSQAKTITNEDLQSLEQSIEPSDEATTQEATQEEAEEEQTAEQQTTEEESSQAEEQQATEEEQTQEQVATQEEASTEEAPQEEVVIEEEVAPIENQVVQEQQIDEPVVQEEVETDDAAQRAQEEALRQAQEEALKQAEQEALQKQQAAQGLLADAQAAATQAEVEKTTVLTATTQTTTTLATLPSSSFQTTTQTQAQTSANSVNSSLDSAITSLNSASSSNSVDSSTVQTVSTSSTTSTSTANQLVTDKNSFQTNSNTILTQAQAKLSEANTALQNAQAEAQKAQTALEQAQEQGLDSASISAIQTEVDKANASVTAAQTAVTTAQNELTTKTNEINSTTTALTNIAQQAIDDAALLVKISSLLDSLEDTKQASLDTVAAKTSAQTAKTATQTALNDANSAKSSLETVKTEATNFKTATQTAKTTAEDPNSSATLVVSSARTANTNAASAQTKADEAVTYYNQVNTAVTAMGTQLQNAKDAYNLSVTKEAEALTALNAAKATEASIDSSNSSAKTAAQAAVTKAQTAYDDAVAAKAAALNAKNDAQTIFDNANTTILLTNAQSTKNDTQTEATSADTLAKSAVSQVKNIVVTKTKTSLKEDGNSVDNSSDTFELSPENTNAQTTGQNFGGYTGTSQLGVFKTNESDANPSYLVQADNLLEVFTSYSSPTNTTDSLTVYGNNFAGNYDNSKIYIYKSFKILETDGSNGSFSTDTTISFYNPATNSFTSLSKDFYKEGASTFVAGTNTKVVVTKNSFNLGNDSFLDSIDKKDSTSGTNAIKGSQAQGNVQTVTYDDASKDISASYLNNKTNQDSSPITKTLTGSTFLIDHDGSTSTGNRLDKNLSITITDNGANGISISATPKYDNNNNINTYSGSTKADTLTAYYINSDIWGAKETGGDGFIMAVPDGGYDSNGKFTIYDENDNPLTSDDDSSWGYWTGTTDSYNKSINPRSAWVAGIETSTAIVQGLIDGNSQTLTFNGKVMGTVDTIHAIKMDDTNKVALNFNVGGGTANLTGSMQFTSTNNHSFNVGIDTANTTVNSSGFTGKFNGSGVSSSYNYLNGKYYGDGEVKSVGGAFQVEQNNHRANGVFKATKQ